MERSDVISSEDTLVRELHENAKSCLWPYIEQAEYGQVHTDPASAFFDFIVQVVQQVNDAFDDSSVLECLADAFTMLDNDLTETGYHLFSTVVDEDLTPKISVRLTKAEDIDADPLMRMSLDMPMIRTVIAKRARYR